MAPPSRAPERLMIELAILAVLGMAVLALAAGAVLLVGLRVLLWLVLLPFRLLFLLLLLPFLILKAVIGGTFFLIGPLLAIVGIAAGLLLALALSIPFLPLLAIAFVIWVVMRSARRPALVKS
jgi:hypothetical protein